MENIILFDDSQVRDRLLPLTFTRPVAELRVGILTIREKWERALEGRASYITQDYLSEKFPIRIKEVNYVINGAVMPTSKLCQHIEQLGINQALLCDGELVAAKLSEEQFDKLIDDEAIDELDGYEINPDDLFRINNIWEIFTKNGKAIEYDFALLTKNRQSQPISLTNTVFNRDQIFIEEGANVECAILNAKNGPIYIGAHAEIMEGAIIRGPFALCQGAQVKMGAKIYGPTTIGPQCRVGGEINNSVMIGYSNKGHDGFLGNSIIGEWCNLGADSNNSNLKNTYDEVKLWSYVTNRFEPTGMQFCGLIMGDHSKCGINTMFNTGTVVGVSANIFGAGFPRNFVPSFAWGGSSTPFSTYRIDKALEAAERVMTRRAIPLTDEDITILNRVYEETAPYRTWDSK